MSIALAFLLCSCAAQKTQEPAQSQEAAELKPLSENFRNGLARLRNKDAHALEAGVARQSISPEAEAAKRAAAASMRLQPGEKLWLQSGKSRVIRHSSPVRRVAIDSKSTGETLEFWGKEEILSDVVRVIRTFKPDVIVTRFTSDRGGPRQSHGLGRPRPRGVLGSC